VVLGALPWQPTPNISTAQNLLRSWKVIFSSGVENAVICDWMTLRWASCFHSRHILNGVKGDHVEPQCIRKLFPYWLLAGQEAMSLPAVN